MAWLLQSLGRAVGLVGPAAPPNTQIERDYLEKKEKEKRLIEIEKELFEKYDTDILSISPHQRSKAFILSQYNTTRARGNNSVALNMQRVEVDTLLKEYFKLKEEIGVLQEKTSPSFRAAAAAARSPTGRGSPVGFMPNGSAAAAAPAPARSPNAPIGFQYAAYSPPPLAGRRSPTLPKAAVGPAGGEGPVIAAPAALRPSLQAYVPHGSQLTGVREREAPKPSVGGRKKRTKSHGHKKAHRTLSKKTSQRRTKRAKRSAKK